MHHHRIVLCLLLIVGLVQSQTQYQDYEEDYYGNGNDYYGGGGGDYGGDDYQDDNLYQDYAQGKMESAPTAAAGGGGIGFGKFTIGCIASWIIGARFHSGRAVHKLKTRHQKEQKQLYSQYYNDVYKLSEQNQLIQKQVDELKALLKKTEAKAEAEALQRDYDEFKQPDIDGDDRISRAEFNMYVKNYLANYPGLSEKDYPKFDDFDHDGDGFVSFQEYAQQMALQAQKAELEQMYSGGSSNNNKAKAMNDLYKATTGGGGART